MISDKSANDQINRLTGLDFFPKAREAVKELKLALQAANTQAIAEATITDILRELSSCPKPSLIREMVYDRNAAEEKRPRCPACNGDGWVTRWYLRTQDQLTKRWTGTLLEGIVEQSQAHQIASTLPNHQTVASGSVACACKSANGIVAPGRDRSCAVCHGHGFLGGDLPGSAGVDSRVAGPGPYCWCTDCARAGQIYTQDPEFIERNNRSRDYLLEKFPGKKPALKRLANIETIATTTEVAW